MAQNPVLLQLQCTPAGSAFTVRMVWQPIDGQSYFYAAIFNAATNAEVVHKIVNADTAGTTAMFMNQPLDPATTYVAQVAQCDAQGTLTSAYSQPLTVLQTALSGITTVNDLTAVAVAATLPTVGPATGMAAQLLDANNTLVVAETLTGAADVLVPPQPLTPGKTYTLYLAPSANGGLSTGPTATVPLVTSAPVVGAVDYDGTALTITAATAMTGGTTLSGALLADGVAVQQGTGDAAKVTLAVPASTLVLSHDYAATLRAVAGGNSGPASPAAPMVVVPPQLTTAYYTGGHAGATWTVPPIAPMPSGAYLSVTADGATVGTPQTTLGYRGDIDISATHVQRSLSIAARSVFGVATGPAATIPLPFQPPVIAAVTATRQGIAVTWTDAGAAAGYRLSLVDAQGVPVQSVATGGLAGGLPLPADLAAAYSVAVQAAYVSAGVTVTGPLSAAVPLLVATPTVTATSYDGTAVTVTWAAPAQTAGVTGYEAVLLHADTLQPTGASKTAAAGESSAAITANLDADSKVVAAVRATGAGASGPLGPAVDVIAVRPVVTASDVSATSLHVAWSAAPSTAVTSYLVSIADPADPSHPQQWVTSATALDVPNTLTVAMVDVTVVARGAQATGPVSMTANLFGTAPSFYPQLTGGVPWLVRSASNQPAAADITFAFPDLFTTTPATLPQAGVFKLEANAASTLLPYKLTIAGNSIAWNFEPTARAALSLNFTDFLKALEKPDGSTVTLKPGALMAVRQTLALGLPLLFTEQLRYMYGFDPDPSVGGYVDLVPGMRLRVDGEMQQLTPPANNQTGNVPIGAATYDIQSYPQGAALQTGFNAFLSMLGRPTVPSPLTGVNAGGGGIIDLYNAAGRLPYFRLLYPSQVRDPRYSGLIDQAVVPVILGAPDYTTLLAATAKYVAEGNFNGVAGIYPFYFRGRATLTPEIAVSLNGQRSWVTLGSTVANLLAPLGAQPGFVTAAVGGFAMRRSIGALANAVAAASIATTAIATNRVRLEYSAATFTPTQPGFFGLPLFGGDDIRLGHYGDAPGGAG